MQTLLKKEEEEIPSLNRENSIINKVEGSDLEVYGFQTFQQQPNGPFPPTNGFKYGAL